MLAFAATKGSRSRGETRSASHGTRHEHPRRFRPSRCTCSVGHTEHRLPKRDRFDQSLSQTATPTTPKGGGLRIILFYVLFTQNRAHLFSTAFYNGGRDARFRT